VKYHFASRNRPPHIVRVQEVAFQPLQVARR
jgi:hypothetical protein